MAARRTWNVVKGIIDHWPLGGITRPLQSRPVRPLPRTETTLPPTVRALSTGKHCPTPGYGSQHARKTHDTGVFPRRDSKKGSAQIPGQADGSIFARGCTVMGSKSWVIRQRIWDARARPAPVPEQTLTYGAIVIEIACPERCDDARPVATGASLDHQVECADPSGAEEPQDGRKSRVLVDRGIVGLRPAKKDCPVASARRTLRVR